MNILAFEFSSSRRSVAVLAEGRFIEEVIETDGRATPAFALVEGVLSGARIEREDIEVIAIGLGPGSYTGIRSALALAQGWLLARPVKLIGIASSECIAARAQAAGLHGMVNVVIDAQRNELCVARYEITADKLREDAALALAAPGLIEPRIAAGELAIGPEASRWFKSGRNLHPSAEVLARLVAVRTDFVASEKLEPIYLREANFVKAPPPRIPPRG